MISRYTNINESPLREYNDIPYRYEKEIDGVLRQVVGYRLLSDTVHKADGWREIEKPAIDADKQYYGAIIYAKGTDTASYEVLNRTDAELQEMMVTKAQRENKEAFEAFQEKQVLATVQNMSNIEALANPELFPVIAVGLEAKAGNKYYSVLDGLLECTNDCTVTAVVSNPANFKKVVA